MGVPREIEGRWTSRTVLKRDHFSTVERGRFITAEGEVEAVLRRIDEVPWWTYGLARHLFTRERRALLRASGLGVAAPLLFAGRHALVRGWIDGVALQIAKPYGDSAYFASAKAALRSLHRAGICHNDLSKQQNWLRGRDGHAYLTDFSWPPVSRGAARCFGCSPTKTFGACSSTSIAICARNLPQPSGGCAVARAHWHACGSSLSNRSIDGSRAAFSAMSIRRAAGNRLAYDSPRLIKSLRSHPGVRDVAIVAFYDRGEGSNLYAFVEACSDLSKSTLRNSLHIRCRQRPAQHIHISQCLPRDPSGKLRTEILQLVASNQLDAIKSLVTSETQREIVAQIVAERRNLHDRF